MVTTRSRGGPILEGIPPEGRAPGAIPRMPTVVESVGLPALSFGGRASVTSLGFGSRMRQTFKGFGQRVSNAIRAIPFKNVVRTVGYGIVGAATGAAIGSVVPGLGTVAGAIYGGVSGVLGANPTIRRTLVEGASELNRIRGSLSGISGASSQSRTPSTTIQPARTPAKTPKKKRVRFGGR